MDDLPQGRIQKVAGKAKEIIFRLDDQMSASVQERLIPHFSMRQKEHLPSWDTGNILHLILHNPNDKS